MSRARALRIALHHTRFAAAGGVEAYLFRLVHELLAAGHTVDFYAERFLAPLEHPRFTPVRVRVLRLGRTLRCWSFARNVATALRAARTRQPYDLVMGFGRTFSQELYRDGSGCRRDYQEQYLDPVHRRTAARRWLSRLSPYEWLVERIERRRYGACRPRLVIAISELVRQQILRRHGLPPEQVRVIYSGVDCERFHPRRRAAGRALVETLLASPSHGDAERRVLLFVGSDYERKGLDIALEALAGLPPGDPARSTSGAATHPWTLLVAGRDNHPDAWAARARGLGVSDRVRFLGWREDVPDLLAGADVLLLPSHFDAFSNIVGEAMASGTPAIVSPHAGAAEWVVDGRTGWRPAENRPASFRAAITEFLAVADLAPLRAAARAHAERYRWEAHFAVLERVLQGLAADPGTTPRRTP